MSDIIQARAFLAEARKWTKQADETMTRAWSEYKTADEWVEKALRLMRREPRARSAKAKYVPVTEAIRRKVARLAMDPRLTTHEIANLVGLRNSGRVSEILNGRR